MSFYSMKIKIFHQKLCVKLGIYPSHVFSYRNIPFRMLSICWFCSMFEAFEASMVDAASAQQNFQNDFINTTE